MRKEFCSDCLRPYRISEWDNDQMMFFEDQQRIKFLELFSTIKSHWRHPYVRVSAFNGSFFHHVLYLILISTQFIKWVAPKGITLNSGDSARRHGGAQWKWRLKRSIILLYIMLGVTILETTVRFCRLAARYFQWDHNNDRSHHCTTNIHDLFRGHI